MRLPLSAEGIMGSFQESFSIRINKLAIASARSSAQGVKFRTRVSGVMAEFAGVCAGGVGEIVLALMRCARHSSWELSVVYGEPPAKLRMKGGK